MRIAVLGLVAAACPIVGTSHASDGVLEIHPTRAESTGCLDGDSPGWPVMSRPRGATTSRAISNGNAPGSVRGDVDMSLKTVAPPAQAVRWGSGGRGRLDASPGPCATAIGASCLAGSKERGVRS